MSLEIQLRELGLRAEMTVMMHASMNAIGVRAEKLLDAIQSVIGSDGTMIMVLGADPDEPFDRITTEVDVEDMGVLAEVFRLRAGENVSDHPAARFGVIGPDAFDYLSRDPLHHYYGPGSLLEHVAEHAFILRLGPNIDTTTVTHWAEYVCEVRKKKSVRRKYVRADTGEVWIESLDDSEGIVQWSEGDYFSQIMIDFLTTNAPKTGLVGDAESQLFKASDYVAFAVRWMEQRL